MRRLWVAVALAPLTFAASPALAATTCAAATSTAPAACTIGGSNTTPVDTATINGGAADNIIVSGTISPTTASTAAVTIDSANNVSNTGSISYTGVSPATGVQANSGASGLIYNTGTISVSETTTGDTTNQGFSTGPFANGSSRFGIHFLPGSFTGATDANNSSLQTVIDNTGTISVIGENSAGIFIESNVTGGILQAGSISVTGGNATAPTDVSYGLLSTGAITGAVNITGSVSVVGQNAVAVALNQGATGAVTVEGTLTATGYRSSTNPGLTLAPKLNPDQVLIGGPALYLGGSVTGGLNVTAAVAATTTAAAITAGTVTSVGSAPAILIGGPGALAVGPVAGTTGANDVIIGGTVSAQGVYDSLATSTATTHTANAFDATAIQIGGSNNLPVSIGGTGIGATSTGGVAAGGNFGAVTLAEGMSITGAVEANTLATTTGQGAATGIDIGAAANVHALSIASTGTLLAAAQTSFVSGDTNGTSVTALKIESGGTLSSLNNDGVISATVAPIQTLQGNIGVYTGGASTIAPVAVLDAGGNLTSITNTYKVVAGDINAPTALISPSGVNTRGVAFDLRANTAGVTLTQSPFVGTLPTGVTSITPSITGDILFGSGAANLDVETGTVTGNIFYGASGGNSLTISGGSTVTGGLSEVGGGALAINVANGSLYITAPTATAAPPAAGTTTTAALAASPGTVNVSTLHVGSTSSITFTVDPAAANASAPQLSVSQATTLDSGSKVSVALTSKLVGASQSFTLIQNTNGSTFTSNAVGSLIGGIPFLYKSTVVANQGVNGSLTYTIGQKTASDLTGFSSAEKNAFEPFYAAANDPTLLADILSKTDSVSFRKAYDQFLPDFGGGPFQTLELGQEAVYRAESDVPLKLQSDQRRGWVQEIGYLDHRSNGDSGGYDGGGFGLVGGVESAQGDGAVGVTAAYLTTNVKDSAQSSDGHLAGSLVEAGVYWRSGGTGLNFDASVNGGWAWFDSKRMFLDSGAPDPSTGTSTTVAAAAQSNWNGGVVAAHFGVKAPMDMGRIYVRPEASVDYYALFEGAHSEHGGGAAFDLSVASRTSQETLAQADLVLGANLGEVIKWRPELTVGWREVVEGGPGKTTANFTGGTAFTIAPNFQDKGGLLARLGLRAGGAFADFSADAGGEFLNGSQNYDARALARFLF